MRLARLFMLLAMASAATAQETSAERRDAERREIERRSGVDRDPKERRGSDRRASDSEPRVNIGPVSIRVPVTWRRAEKDGTWKFDAPGGDAYFLVDTSKVQTAGMEPRVCRDKITSALAGNGWEPLTLGGYPAAHQASEDVARGGKETVRTHAFVGCNGDHTWSILFHMNRDKAKAYEQTAVIVAKSLEYIDGPKSLAAEEAELHQGSTGSVPLPEPRPRPGRVENP